MINIITSSAEETKKCGRLLAKVLKPEDIVILEGDLGAGKTTFVKGVLEGFGYKKMVKSPTFTLVRQYLTRGLYINHIDLYRIDDREMFTLGLDEMLYSKHSLSFIEWGGKLQKSLDRYLRIDFSFLGPQQRKISFSLKQYDETRSKLIKKILKNKKVC